MSNQTSQARIFRLMSIDTLKNASLACKVNNVPDFWTPTYLYHHIPSHFKKSVFTTCSQQQWTMQVDLYRADGGSHHFTLTGEYDVDDVIHRFNEQIMIANEKKTTIDYSRMHLCFVDEKHFKNSN